jgi:sulfotransferase family protein
MSTQAPSRLPSTTNDAGALPNLIIIGARKCGTTSLHYYLDQHPEISMSRTKELGLFTRTEWQENVDWYRRQFDPDAPVRGEGTPAYTTYPLAEDVPERINALVPEAKLIYSVGDPVQRIVAQWVQWYATEVDLAPESVNARMASEPLSEILRNYDDPGNSYVCPSRYATQLERYLDVFDRSQIMVVDQFDLKHRRVETMKEIFRFLEVDDAFESPAFSQELNTHNEKFRPQAGFSRLRRAALSAGLRHVPPRLRRPIAKPLRRAFSEKVDRPTIHPEIMAGLELLLKDEADRLRELTGKSFPHWGV